VVLAPVLLAISLAIIIDSGGAPLYRQTRVGHGGKHFTIWKFRSMYRGADRLLAQLMEQNEANGHIFKMKHDPRVTRVGRVLRRTSLDELPQLWNVLNGTMSLVGPRPPTAGEVDQYAPEQLGRLATVPGITGLWQVTKRGEHNFDDMVTLDVEYARRLSFRLDVAILARTIPTVLFGKGSY
jgi:lipopolysaccharide/colanic/teichoic acid biosynthesis glycosyltransferase